jgi:preprotein translocase subunit SecA
LEAKGERINNLTYTAPTETGEVQTQVDESTRAALPVARAAVAKVGRNDPCPCGSGKKYKQCHGKLS